MKIVIAKDEGAFIKETGRLLLETATAKQEKDGKVSVAFSGGRTPGKIYSSLADTYFKQRMPWNNMTFYWGDERCVPPDHPDSNYRMTHQTLLSKIPISSSHVFRIPAEMENPRDAAKSYENTLRVQFKVEKSLPRFDFIFLGIGEDGHTASLFPNTAAVKEKQRWVVANYVEKLSTNRISLTFPVLNNAGRLVFMCSGSSKAHIVREIFRDDISDSRYPAQLVRPTSGELIWVLDGPAASKLPSSITNQATHV